MEAHAHTNKVELVTEEAGESISYEELDMIAGGQAVTNSI